MKKYLVKSKIGIGRDFSVYDDDEGKHKVYFIDSKAGLGSKAEIKTAEGQVIYKAKGKIINIPRKMEYLTPDGIFVARALAHFSPLKSRLTMELANGDKWELEGNIIEKNYQVKQGGKIIIEMNQKWLTVRDKYFIEIADDVDLPLALGLIWAVDIWREGKGS
jgi:uncharacterized protein YxjI